MKAITSILTLFCMIGLVLYLAVAIVMLIDGNYGSSAFGFLVSVLFFGFACLFGLGWQGFKILVTTGKLPNKTGTDEAILNEVAPAFEKTDAPEVYYEPYDLDLEKYPDSPRKEDPSNMYVDEAVIVERINEAIDHARVGDFKKAEGCLRAAQYHINEWEPYDTSDSFKGQGWQGDVNEVKGYIEGEKAKRTEKKDEPEGSS